MKTEEQFVTTVKAIDNDIIERAKAADEMVAACHDEHDRVILTRYANLILSQRDWLVGRICRMKLDKDVKVAALRELGV